MNQWVCVNLTIHTPPTKSLDCLAARMVAGNHENVIMGELEKSGVYRVGLNWRREAVAWLSELVKKCSEHITNEIMSSNLGGLVHSLGYNPGLTQNTLRAQ